MVVPHHDATRERGIKHHLAGRRSPHRSLRSQPALNPQPWRESLTVISPISAIRSAAMDATAWVAIAGIGGTLLAAVLSPLVTERMHRESVRREHLMSHRLEAYADLLRVTARLADNAQTWSVSPLVDLKETDNDELDRLIARVRVVASKDIYNQLVELTSHAQTFTLGLFETRTYHSRIRQAGTVDDATAIKQRMALATLSDQITEMHKGLEKVIRKEFQS
jgi:hypothetical protein